MATQNEVAWQCDRCSVRKNTSTDVPTPTPDPPEGWIKFVGQVSEGGDSHLKDLCRTCAAEYDTWWSRILDSNERVVLQNAARAIKSLAEEDRIDRLYVEDAVRVVEQATVGQAVDRA